MQPGERIEELIGELGRPAEELAELLMDMYGEGLSRLVTLLAGTPALRTLADDDVVSGLLVLHDLHPDDTATRAARAVDSVRPFLGSHARDLEFLGVLDAPGGPVARLGWRGAGGCPSTLGTVRDAVSGAVERLCPEVVRVEVEGAAEPARKELPLLQIGVRPPVATA
jgi:Fe-S cluster biogenesis protein NfuA